MKIQLNCEDNLRGSFKQIYRRYLLSLELEINLKPVELFTMSTGRVPEDHEHRQTPQTNRES